MSTLAIWCRVVQSRDLSLHNFDGLAKSGFAFSVAPAEKYHLFLIGLQALFAAFAV